MAIGGHSWAEGDTDWGMIEGRGPDMFDQFFAIRMEFEGDRCIKFASVRPQVRVPMELIDQKLALLKTAPAGAKVPNVGWRRTENIFYLHIYENELPLGEYK